MRLGTTLKFFEISKNVFYHWTLLRKGLCAKGPDLYREPQYAEMSTRRVESRRGERVARETRLVDPKLESSRLASPRVQASRTRLDSLKARRVGSRTRLARADSSANLTHRLLR